MNKKVYKIFGDILVYILGGFIYSAAVTMLISPNEISPGGFTGIATVLQYLFGLPTGAMLFALNIPVLIMGFISFGGIFIFKTAAATVIMSLTLEICEAVLPVFKVDKILACVFGGILMGLGLSLIMLKGATSGGVDIIAKFINRRYPHLTVGRLILFSDALVVAVTAIVYKNIESALYSVVSLYASSKIVDVMLYGSDKGKIIYIITNKAKEISNEIIAVLQRGVTEINVVGSFTGKQRKMLMCTVRRQEVSLVLNITRNLDNDSFIVVGEAGEIFGQGFKKI
ncbi:MAG: YitT family protein [Clostridia bacterium]|nr:YitT family protein [Clostridia bacterium]